MLCELSITKIRAAAKPHNEPAAAVYDIGSFTEFSVLL